MNVRFCPSCRGLILSDFRFCPYCGAEAPRGPGFEEALVGPFSRIEAAREDCFAPVEERLRRLEAELEGLCERKGDA